MTKKYVVIDTNVLVSANGLEVTELIEIKETVPDPKDIVFYAVTLSAQDKNVFLVTGNGKHFPRKPFVVTPLELVEILEGV